MSGIRQLILQLLRTLNRRVERVEDQGVQGLELQREIKQLLVDLRRDHGELHSRVIQLADEHGGALRQHERAILDKERRLVHVERRASEQANEIAELTGRVLRVESRGGNGAAE
jgi:hypothetical protein